MHNNHQSVDRSVQVEVRDITTLSMLLLYVWDLCICLIERTINKIRPIWRGETSSKINQMADFTSADTEDVENQLKIVARIWSNRTDHHITSASEKETENSASTWKTHIDKTFVNETVAQQRIVILSLD